MIRLDFFLPRHTGEVPPKGAEGEGHTEIFGNFRSEIGEIATALSPSGPAGHLPRKTGEAELLRPASPVPGQKLRGLP